MSEQRTPPVRPTPQPPWKTPAHLAGNVKLAVPPKSFQHSLGMGLNLPQPSPAPDIERYARIGDVVFWYPSADPGTTPMIGIVSGIGAQFAVDVNVFTPALHGSSPQEGAMHMDDPRARTEKNGGGGWRHKPETVAFRRLFLALGMLEWDGYAEFSLTRTAVLDRLVEVLSRPEPEAASPAA